MRRKTLFHTVNLIIPCVAITFLTVLVFYLPSDSGEKISLCISILLSLTVFFLLLAEIIPPTSIVVPLIGKYLLFTMILVTLSIIVTVIVLNVHFRSPATHTMAPWVSKVFLDILPQLLVMRRPASLDAERFLKAASRARNGGFEIRERLPSTGSPPHGGTLAGRPDCSQPGGGDLTVHGSAVRKYCFAELSAAGPLGGDQTTRAYDRKTTAAVAVGDRSETGGREGGRSLTEETLVVAKRLFPNDVKHAIEGARFIADHLKYEDEGANVREDWKYVALVLDRLFLWIFTTACLVGTFGIILQAPTIYDLRQPVTSF